MLAKRTNQWMRLIKDWPPELPLTVAVTIASASRLIADVQIDNGFLLVLGATPKAAIDRSTAQMGRCYGAMELRDGCGLIIESEIRRSAIGYWPELTWPCPTGLRFGS